MIIYILLKLFVFVVYIFISVESQCIYVVIEGKFSFKNESLHAIVNGDTLNPYQEVIYITGKELVLFDGDCIRCYGFGDGRFRSMHVYKQLKSSSNFLLLVETITDHSFPSAYSYHTGWGSV